jgi:SAM-dependent methyltransferase
MVKSRRPLRVLDVGCGSGVLAIAAARALRIAVVAGDIDRRAVSVARENVRANHAGGLVEVVHAAGVRAPRIRRRAPFDLVLANILLGPLTRLAAPLADLLAPGARVVLSGLLPGHANAALAAYRAQRLFLVRRIELEGWVTLVLARRGRCGGARLSNRRGDRVSARRAASPPLAGRGGRRRAPAPPASHAGSGRSRAPPPASAIRGSPRRPSA